MLDADRVEKGMTYWRNCGIAQSTSMSIVWMSTFLSRTFLTRRRIWLMKKIKKKKMNDTRKLRRNSLEIWK